MRRKFPKRQKTLFFQILILKNIESAKYGDFGQKVEMCTVSPLKMGVNGNVGHFPASRKHRLLSKPYLEGAPEQSASVYSSTFRR